MSGGMTWGTLGRMTSATDSVHDATLELDAVVLGAGVAGLYQLHQLREQGLRVPEDVSVAGFDDLPFSADAAPSLTTVRLHLQDAGARAGRLALGLQAPPPGGVATVRAELMVLLFDNGLICWYVCVYLSSSLTCHTGIMSNMTQTSHTTTTTTTSNTCLTRLLLLLFKIIAMCFQTQYVYLMCACCVMVCECI